jgi:hypothetical protein
MHHNQRRSENTAASARWRSATLFGVRYGLGGAMILTGIVVLVATDGDLGAYGFASAVGAGLSILLLNLLYRMSVSSDRDRAREEEARRHFDAHGLWPDDEQAPERMSKRLWTLPAGAVTAEQEERERRLSKPVGLQPATREPGAQ